MNRCVSFMVSFAVFCSWSPASAQGRPQLPPSAGGGVKVISGEVAYSDPNAPALNAQGATIQALEEWGAQLKGIVTTSGAGKISELDQNAVAYLSVLYLFCSAKRGPCPFILETILDADIALSRAENNVQCPLTKRFFKSYVARSLDERGKFLFSLTQGLEIAKFNTNERPRFVGCKDTIAAMIADKEILSERFGEKGTAAKTVDSLLGLLAEVREQKIDIFVSTGVALK
jgi:hypothetical protein